MPSGYIDQGLPFSGATSMSAHASWTGAEAAAETRKGQTARYIRALVGHPDGLTDHQAVALTGIQLASINSIRNGLGCCVQKHGYQRVERPNGLRRKFTLRTIWKWVGEQGVQSSE